MLQVLKSYPAVEVQRPGVSPEWLRVAVRGALSWSASSAARLAIRLKKAELAIGARPAAQAAVGVWSPARRSRVRFVDALVSLALTAYFGAGLLGVLAAW